MTVHALGAGMVLAAMLVASPAPAQNVGPADVQKALGGKRVSLSCADGTTGSGRYVMGRSVGTISGTYQRPDTGPLRDVGRVRAAGDQLCLQFKMLNGGQEACFGVRQESETLFTFTRLGGLVSACQVAAL